MTRTNSKFFRVYANGYDISGQARDIGTVGYKADAPTVAAYSDAVKNTVLGQVQMQCGPLNAFLSPSSGSGLHEIGNAGNSVFDVMVAFGVLAAPKIGDPVYAWRMYQGEYKSTGEGVVGVNLAFPDSAYSASNNYSSPFGYLLHASGAETGANTAVGVVDAGGATTKGGIFVYQLFSSDGTVTLSVDDSATNLNNAAFSALSGATSGSINASTTPQSGFIALATTATVRQYLRWQLAFGTASTATFACAFLRGY
jgi:hypothetical protein